MRRSVKYGSNTLLFTVIIIAVLVLVNIISAKHYNVIDVTSSSKFSLSPQTLKVLRSLGESVKVLAFVKTEQSLAVADFLDQYVYISERLKYEIIDPDKKPGLAKKYKVDRYGVFVVEASTGRKEIISELSEEELTNAIIKATTTEQKKIYVLEGHGERSMDDTNQQGWSAVNEALLQAGYMVTPLNWFETGSIPDDIDMLLIPGPKNDMQSGEIDRLREMLDKGIPVFIAIDPLDLPNIQGLLGEFGFKFHEEMILDPVSQSLGFEPLVATATGYTGHPVSKEMKAATFFPVARSIDLEKENRVNAELAAIASTATQSWSETSLASIEKGTPEFEENDDLPGPRIVVAAAQWDVGPSLAKRKIGEKAIKARMVVAGDSDFASNATLGLSANRDLFMNITGWLLEQENRISIRPKDKAFNPVMFTSFQLKVIFWSVVAALPFSVAVLGVIVRSRRRRS